MGPINLTAVLLMAGISQVPGSSLRTQPTPVLVRQAVEKSLPYLEKGGTTWIKERKCVSCHMASFMLWSHNEARQAGIPVDQLKLTEWTNWSIDHCATARDKDGKRTGAGLDTMSQMILLRDTSLLNDKAKEQLQSLVPLIVEMQQADGSWAPGGQLPGQRRPAPETKAVTTMWTVLALASLPDLTEDQLKSRQRALDWLKNVKPGISSESLLLHVLIEHQFGSEGRAQELLEELLGRQKPDGGWSWLKDEKSDGFATGQVLYALNRVGLASEHEAIKRAWGFLVQTQRPDGSWYVPTTKKGKKEDNDGMSSYWGTGWAAIGLARTLPR